MIVANIMTFGRDYIKPNTFIGGVASSINNAIILAQKLGLSVSRIRNFKIIGNDIEFAIIGGNYILSSNFGFTSNTSITYYRDEANLLTNIGFNVFRGCTNLFQVKANGLLAFGSYSIGGQGTITNTKIVNLNFPNCTLIGLVRTFDLNALLKTIIMPNVALIGGGHGMRSCPLLELVDLRKTKAIGHPDSAIKGEYFLGSGIVGCILKVHVDCLTSDLGGVDRDCLYAKNTRSWVVEFYDNNGNYVSTL
jgi:hypothetical protein